MRHAAAAAAAPSWLVRRHGLRRRPARREPSCANGPGASASSASNAASSRPCSASNQARALLLFVSMPIVAHARLTCHHVPAWALAYRRWKAGWKGRRRAEPSRLASVRHIADVRRGPGRTRKARNFRQHPAHPPPCRPPRSLLHTPLTRAPPAVHASARVTRDVVGSAYSAWPRQVVAPLNTNRRRRPSRMQGLQENECQTFRPTRHRVRILPLCSTRATASTKPSKARSSRASSSPSKKMSPSSTSA